RYIFVVIPRSERVPDPPNQVGNDGIDNPAMHFCDTLFRGNDCVVLFCNEKYWCIFNALLFNN
ncbi:MAG: hypothetical protein JXX14_17920, partial [Deltaproteobacteria bacterium]|nr:hypothetical protein [Deltaproteobacteria bacterium]